MGFLGRFIRMKRVGGERGGGGGGCGGQGADLLVVSV